MAKKTETKKTSAGLGSRIKQETDFPMNKQNYILAGIGIGLMILGFILLSGTSHIFDFRKLYVAPVVLLAGFVLNIFAIMKKTAPKEETEA